MTISVYQSARGFRVVAGEHKVAAEHKQLAPRVYADATKALSIETDGRIREALVLIGGEATGARHVVERATDADAAANCRAILAQLTVAGKINHKAFLAEMDRRSVEAYGHKCTPKQYALLGQIAAAYAREVQS